MESKKIKKLRQGQEGITLVALIITIIVLVILAAVSIVVVYNSNIVNYVINGAMKYGQEGINENKVMEGTESLIDSTVDNIEGILGGNNQNSEESTLPEKRHIITFYIYNNQNKIEEVAEEITLPNIEEIEVEGKTYTARGWATSTEPNAEVMEAGTKVEVTEDIIYYASYEVTETAKFYYNRNRTSGSLTVANIIGTATKQMNYIGEKIEETLTIPTEVMNSVGRYNSVYAGVSSSMNTMSTTNTIRAGSTYYATYSAPVTIYYPNSKTTATNYTKYRNEYFTGTNAMSTVLTDSSTGIANYEFNSGVSGYSLQGFGVNEKTTTRKYSSIATLAKSSTEVAYVILYKASGSNTYYTYCTGTTTATCTESLTSETLGESTMIGKYVDYVPAGIDYTVDSTYYSNSSDSSQTLLANNSMKWRIWGVSENKLLLISETLAKNKIITLSGHNGYNNGVKILNDACSTAFGNNSYGSAINVRSINQDDIDKVTNMTIDTQRKAVNSNYGTTVAPTYNKLCPSIYGQEPGGEGFILDRNTQPSWYDGTTTFTSRKYTSYNYDITKYATQTMYDALLTNMTANSNRGATNQEGYWVASRCVTIDTTQAIFGLFYVGNGEINIKGTCTSKRLGNSDTCTVMAKCQGYVRPIVEVNLDYISIGIIGSGTDTDPFSMTAK